MLGSGTGKGSHIDSDIIVDENGLPIFPGRRLKGLLRESALEVMEMFDLSELREFISMEIDEIFGSETKAASIRIDNLYPPDYHQTIACLSYGKQNYPQLINKETIINALTNIRQQTSLDENGVAREGSLRSIRILKSPYNFTGYIEIIATENQAAIENLLALTCLNLRRVGSNRNRGWGEIAISLYSSAGDNLTEKIVEKLKTWSPGQVAPVNSKNKDVVAENYSEKELSPSKGYTHKLEYTISNTAPLLFTAPDGDENMVTSLDYIPGSALHGYYANQLIRNMGLKSSQAQENEFFYQWFLEGHLAFTNAYLRYNDEYSESHRLYPVPSFIHTDKTREEVFNLILDKPEDSQGMKGFVAIKDGYLIRKSPGKSISFHLVRNAKTRQAQERIDGHSTEGGIFHYESMEVGQEFHGYILGDEKSLTLFTELLANDSTIKLGRSISTQYGTCNITFGNIMSNDISVDDNLWGEKESNPLPINQLLLYFISPVIVNNEYGYSTPDIANLLSILAKKLDLKKEEIKIISSFAREMENTSFIAHWKMGEPMMKGWIAGSSFLIQLKDGLIGNGGFDGKLSLLMQEGIGEKRHLGFGQVRLMHSLPEINGISSNNRKVEIDKPDMVSGLANQIISWIYNDYQERIILATATRRASSYYENNKENNKENDKEIKLSTNLIGRLERIIQESRSPADLAEQIKQLRDKAQNPLRKYNLNKESNLFDDLTNMNLETWRKSTDTDMFKLLNKLGEDFALEVNDKELYKKYWQVFLRTLRKAYKEADKKKEGGNTHAIS